MFLSILDKNEPRTTLNVLRTGSLQQWKHVRQSGTINYQISLECNQTVLQYQAIIIGVGGGGGR